MRNTPWPLAASVLLAGLTVFAIIERPAEAASTDHVAVQLTDHQAADLGATVAKAIADNLPASSLENQIAGPIGADAAKRVDGSLTLASASWTEAVASDIPGLNQDVNKAQIVTILNLEGSNKICVTWVPRTVSGTKAADCSTRSGTITETCSATPGPGVADYALPGTPWQRVLDGDQCVFVKAVVDQSDYQIEIIAR